MASVMIGKMQVNMRLVVLLLQRVTLLQVKNEVDHDVSLSDSG